MKTTTRPKLTADEIRQGLWALGLSESKAPMWGYAFTFMASPSTAVQAYADQHNGTLPTRFWIDRRTFLLN